MIIRFIMGRLIAVLRRLVAFLMAGQWCVLPQHRLSKYEPPPVTYTSSNRIKPFLKRKSKVKRSISLVMIIASVVVSSQEGCSKDCESSRVDLIAEWKYEHDKTGQ